MRKSIINLLLSNDETVVHKGSQKFQQYNQESVSQLLLDVNKKLSNHRRYCSTRGIDYRKIESEEAFK